MKLHSLLYLSMAVSLAYPMQQPKTLPTVTHALVGDAVALEVLLPVIKELIQPAAKVATVGVDVLMRKDFAPLIDSKPAQYFRTHHVELAKEYTVLAKCLCEVLQHPKALVLASCVKNAVKALVVDPAFGEVTSGKDLLNLKGYGQLKSAVGAYVTVCAEVFDKHASQMPLVYSALSKVHAHTYVFALLEEAFSAIELGKPTTNDVQKRIEAAHKLDVFFDTNKLKTMRDTAVVALIASTLVVPGVISLLGEEDVWQWVRSLRIENGAVRRSVTTDMPEGAAPLVVALHHVINYLRPPKQVLDLK